MNTLLNFFFKPNPEAENIEEEPDHDHAWVQVSKTYAPPRRDVKTEGITNDVTMERALFGITQFLYKCTVCNEFYKDSMLGSDVDTLDELMQKADEYGPQYIMQGDKTFVVLRNIPQPPGTIPLR